VVETFTRSTIQLDTFVSEYVPNHPVQLRLLELAAIDATIFLQAFKGGWAFDRFFEEISQVDRTIKSAQKTVCDTAAFDIGTLIKGAVLVGGERGT
jgi:hypothetical protein